MRKNKTAVGNEVAIFLTLTKSNTSRRREEGKPLLMVFDLMSILTLLIVVTNVFVSNGTYPLIFTSTVYNIISPYGVVLCCYQKRFSFSLKVSLS